MGQNAWSYFDGSVVRNHMIKVWKNAIHCESLSVALKRRQNAKTKECYDWVMILGCLSNVIYPGSAGYPSNTKQ